uniref:Uncharacterized protein n=1 Tax=Timema monikensis TaxID=170555 RepID=A0A7R9HMG7_9NEOP|nr:unnamed protein product [Timema monikensis]
MDKVVQRIQEVPVLQAELYEKNDGEVRRHQEASLVTIRSSAGQWSVVSQTGRAFCAVSRVSIPVLKTSYVITSPSPPSIRGSGQVALYLTSGWDGGREGESLGVAPQLTKVSFRANNIRWITDTVDGAGYQTDLQRRSDIPDLAEVLRTVKQAWASPRSCSLDRLDIEAVNTYLRGRRVKNQSGKTIPSSPEQDSNLNLTVLGSLSQHETSALDNNAPETNFNAQMALDWSADDGGVWARILVGAKETRKLHLVEEPNVPTGIGTGQRMSHAGAHPSQHSSPLPHRRYSVPETVMRRYTLTKQRSDSSDSGGVATVPVVTPEAISSDHSNGSKNILEVGKRHGEGDSEDRRRDSPSSNRQNRHRNELFPDKDLVNDKKSSLEHSTSKDSDKNQKRMLEKFNISRSNKIARQLSQDSIDKCFHRRYSEQLTGGSWNRNSLSLIGRSCIFRRRTSYPQARESSAAAALQSSSSTKIQEFKLKMPAIMLEGSSSNYYQTKSDNTLSTQDMTVSIISDLASERNESSLIDGKIISMDYFENEQLSPSATEDNLSVTKPSRKESLGAKFEILSSPTLYPTKSDHTISTQDLTVSLTSELTNGDKNGDSEIDKTSNSKITPNRHFGVEIENLKMLSGSSTTLYPNNSDHTFSTQDATLSLISELTLIDNEALVGESKEDENYDCTCHPVNTSAFGSTPTMDEDFRKEAPRASVGGMSSPTMYPDKSDHTISTQDMTLSLRSESAANQSDQVGDTAKTSSRELNELFRENPSTSENTTFRSNDSRIDTSEIKSNFESSPSFYKTTSDHTISTQDMTLSLRSDSAFTQSEISLANDEIVLPKSSKVIGELHECNKDETPGTDGRLSRRNVLSENKNDPTSDEKDYVLNQDQAEAKEFLNQNEKKLEESQIISQRSNGSGKSYVVKKLSLDEPSQSSSSSPDTGGNNSESRSGQSSGYNESPSGQTSETSTDVSACTPTECIVTTPESDQTHNMSTSSDRISESCSITPVGNSSGSSRPSTTPEGIEIQIKSLENSTTLGQTVSDHTSSTQDMTLSLRSESVVTHNTPDNESGKSSELTSFSDLVQDIEHISFMEDKKEEMIESNVGSIFSVLNVKDKPTNVMPDDVTTRSTQTSAQDDESSSSNDKQVNNNGGGRDSRRSSLKRKTLPKRTVHQTKAVESLSRQGLDYVNATTQDKLVHLDQIEALPPDQYGSTPVEQSKIVPLEISKCYQGRASLMPQAEERDLLSLSKGWINFYLIKENLSTPDESNVEDGSCNTSDKEERRQKLAPLPKTVSVVGGGENRIRQCTVPYRPTPTDDDLATHSPNTALPELLPATRRQSLVPPADRGPLTLPKTPSTPDSDHSTTYLKISGSPRLGISNVLEGSGELACSESSVSSSGDSENDRDGSPAMYPLRWPVRARRSSRPHRTRSRTQNYHQSEATPYQYQQPQQAGGGSSRTGSGWTVTVAGTTTFPQDHHDVEMRLSFPACSRRHTASQSDSGVGEDTNNNGGHHGESQSHFLPPAQMNNTQHWSLTVKNQTGGFDKKQGEAKNGKKLYQCLPDLTLHTDQVKNTKKVIKRPDTGLPVTSVVDEETLKVRAQRRLSLASWPKVHKIVQNKVIIRKASGNVSQEVRSVSHLLEDESGQLVLKSGLTITGSAITPEKKPRVPTMSERDVTRMHTTK